jgi:hypothetical protein
MPFKSRAQKEYLRINEPEIYERWMREYHAESNQSFTPPAAAVAAAKKGLAQRKKWGRGGLSPAEAASQGIDSGVTRARKISSGKVSRHDVRRMSAFNRHRKNNNPGKKMPDGGPTAGTIAWNLWGGTSGVNWAKKKSAAMNAETFDAESWGSKKSMKQWMQFQKETEEEVTWGYFHANLYPPNKLLTKIWTFEGKPNGSVEAWWNTITNQEDDEAEKQLEEVFERHYPIILKSARKDVQQLIEEHNWYDMMSAETFESPVSCKICGKTFDSFRGLNGHMNAHLPPHRKRAEDDEEEEDELRTYEVSVPVLHYYGIGPVEAYDEDEAADEVRNNWGYWRRTIQDNGDWGGPLWRYSPLTSGEPEAYEIFDSETFGDVDSDGQLAQALRAAREKSRRYAPQPLRITKLPHPDQKSLKDFEAETKDLPFSVSRKDIALVSFGAILGVVSGVIGEVLAEFWLDRYRRDPELLTNGDDENA